MLIGALPERLGYSIRFEGVIASADHVPFLVEKENGLTVLQRRQEETAD